MVTSFDKAIVPGIVAIVLAAIGAVGFTGEMTLADAITALVTMVVVYMVPNRKSV